MKKNPVFYIVTVMTGVLLLSGCKVGKSYVRPELNLPDTIAGMADSACLGNVEWKSLYTDSVLQKLIGQALSYNKDMLVAAARMREMAEQKRIATVVLLPEINGKFLSERENENYGGDSPKTSDEFGLKAGISWELDLWGHLRWGREASIAEYMQSVEAQRALKMTLIAEVAQAYYELIALDAELEIVRQTLKAREEGMRLTRIRYEGGLTSEIPYRQSQVELARTSTLVPDLERKITQKENDIAFLTGTYPHRVERGKLIQKISYNRQLPVGLPSDLLERRPDIRQAEQKLIAANAKVGVALTAMFPKISLTSALGAESGAITELLKSPYSIVDGIVTAPLFGWGKNRANWKAKKAAYEAEMYTYEKCVLNAFRETHSAIVYFNKTREVYDLKARLESSSRSYLDLAQLQYINGVISYMDVLDAQRVYFDAQIGLSNAIRDELIALVQVYKALGGGWKPEDFSGN